VDFLVRDRPTVRRDPELRRERGWGYRGESNV